MENMENVSFKKFRRFKKIWVRGYIFIHVFVSLYLVPNSTYNIDTVGHKYPNSVCLSPSNSYKIYSKLKEWPNWVNNDPILSKPQETKKYVT